MKILRILASSDQQKSRDALRGVQAEQWLTLTDADPDSDNRYYIRLSGDAAETDWQAGDKLMVELSLYAYKHAGHWQMSSQHDSIELIEISCNSGINQ